jgi:hypothetical protein
MIFARSLRGNARYEQLIRAPGSMTPDPRDLGHGTTLADLSGGGPMFVPSALALLLAAAPELPPVVPDLTTPSALELDTTPRHRSHPVRALVETTFALAFNVAWYQWDADFNAPDWELRWDRDSWYRKAVTFEAVRLDSNRFSTNAGSHTEGGTLIYLIGRGNGLGPGTSTLLSLGEVIVWEYVGEYFEKPSLNDLLTNPLGGFAVGEPFFQLSEFFARGADNGVNRTLAAIFSPLTPANDWIDGRRRRPTGNTDGLGLTRDITHRFDLYAGMTSARWEEDPLQRTETLLGVRTELNSIPGFGAAHRRASLFGAGRITRLDAGLVLGQEGMTGALFATRVALGGYHWQDLWRDEASELRGTNLIAGLFNSFEYTGRDRPGLPFDQIATFGLLGPMLDLGHRRGALHTHWRLEALPDLAMVTSLPGDRYKERSGTEGLKTVLAQRGYYYAYGLTLGSQMALRYRAFAGGLELHWDRFGSIDARDRYQERLTRDLHLVDRRLRSLVWLGVRPLGSFADIGAALERTSRSGSIEDVTASSVEHRATLTLSLGF